MFLECRWQFGLINRLAKLPFLSIAPPCENLSSNICGQRRPKLDCASAQSDQGHHCPQTESLDTIEWFNGEEMLKWDFAQVQDDVNLHILRMLEGTFSRDAVQYIN